MATVDRAQVIAALEAKRAFILENLQTVTLKKLRVLLEEDMGLSKDDLKPHKDVISDFVDAMMSAPAAEEPAEQEAMEESEEEEDVVKPKKKDKKDKKDKKRKASPSGSAPKAAPRAYTKKVERMRSICRQATIIIPPNTYSKNKGDAELEAALEELLSKHGLTADAGPNEVAKAKAKLQLARDLEGIETSNIIEGGRRARRAATNTASYKDMLAASDSEEEEEEEEEEAAEEDAGSEGEGSEDEGAGAEAEAGDEEEADDDEEAGEDEEDDEEEEGTLSDAKSPETKKPEAKAATPKSEKKAAAAAAPSLAGEALADIGNQPKKQRVGDWSDDE